MTHNVLDLFSGLGAFSLGLERAGFHTRAFCEIDPYCRRVLAKHWPEVPIYDDVRTLTAERLRADGINVDVICGGFPCFPRNTLILAKRGLVDIADLVEGDEVLTHRNRWRRVVRHHGSHKSPTILMRGHGHPAMVTTANHPFWSIRKTAQSTRRNGIAVRLVTIGETEWTSAGDMRGHFWATPAKIPSEMPALPACVIDVEAFFWLLGRWLADGWVVRYKRTSKITQGGRGSRINSFASRVLWCAAKSEADVVARKLSEAGINATRADERTVAKFVIQSANLFEFLVPFGKSAHGKTVPTWLLGAPEHLRRAFLEGYRTGDGNAIRDGWKITTVSKAIAVGIRLLAVGLGWSVAMHFDARPETCVIEGRTVRQRDTWQLVAWPSGRSSFVSGEHRFGLVRSVEETGREEEVFNFEVEEDNTYVADGIVVHNCQDVSRAGKRAGVTGERSGLYRELVRAVRLVRPKYAIVENVAALLGDGMGTVLGDLAESGGCLEWDCVPAQSIGAPHERDRVWIICHAADAECLQSGERHNASGERRWQSEAEQIGLGTRERPIAHAPSIGCGQGWTRRPPDSFAWVRDATRRHVADPDRAGLAQREGKQIDARPQLSATERTAFVDVWQSQWPCEPALLGVDDGTPNRVERVRAIGNSLLPQIPTLIGRAILAAECGHD